MAGKAVATAGKRSLLDVVKGHTSKIPQGTRLVETVMNATGLSQYNEVALNVKHPSAPAVEATNYAPVETRISKLANGVTVVSRDTHDPVAVVGTFLDAGSRDCNARTSGTAHFLESIALEATENRTGLNLYTEIQKAGANLSVTASRDGLMYQCELFRNDADFGLGMIKEIIREPKLESWNFKDYKQRYLWRRGDEMGNPEKQMPELMHQAAWQQNTLGLPLWLDEFSVQNMSSEYIREYLDKFVQPSRIIVGGVGVDHGQMEQLAQNYFGDLTEGAPVERTPARYTGGEIRKTAAMDDDFAHVAVIFETENWKSKDLMAMCTLNMMMGGGGHFSAGGPGKGMYTRIYQEALGQYTWLNGLHCSHSIYEDSAIFAYYGTAAPVHAGNLVEVIAEQARNTVTKKATPDELERAKTALSTNICFDFEDRQVIFEDICRQVQVYGHHKTPNEWHEMIMAVTADDVQRVAERMLKSKPTLVAVGTDISAVPLYDDCVKFLK